MASFTSLYSGSAGNCSVVCCGEQYLMIDMGKSCRATLNALKELNLPLSNMQGILLTHEHSDHVGGLRVFLKKHSVPIYGTSATLDNLCEQQILPPAAEMIAVEGRTEPVGGFEVTAFPTSHDVPCCGYRIKAPDGSVMAIATDLGYVSEGVKQHLTGAGLVALEANYDLTSLRFGKYPLYLKRRIESDRGHLDNTVCAENVVDLMQSGCKNFALCHLSKENNTPQMALSAVKERLIETGYRPDPDVTVQAQKRDEPSDWIKF